MDVDRDRTHPAKWLALAVGIVYTLIGLVGFLVTGFDNFAASNTDEFLLGIFEVNPLHNIAHLVVGLIGLGMWRTLSGARSYGWLLLVIFGVLFLYGIVAAATPADILALNGADNVLHLLTAGLGLVMALMAARGYRAPGAVER